MFTRALAVLAGSAVDPGNIPVPRPYDALADQCAAQTAAALTDEDAFLSPAERLRDPDAYLRLQQLRRRRLESFLWADANAASLKRMLDLVVQICEELRWSADDGLLDDPAHPEIDFQAAETGVLLAWIVHRHGQRLKDMNPRLPSVILSEVRRRLLVPVVAHDDYPFMRGGGTCPTLILCDLLLTCLLLEQTQPRRLQPVKILLRLLDVNCEAIRGTSLPIEEKLIDACAVADLARMLKRLTRGEVDFTKEVPPQGWLDDLLISWAGEEMFFDPAGDGLTPAIAGIDCFRLGYLSKDRALCALGAQLDRMERRESRTVTGRILSMEYMRAMQDETSAPPRLRRAVNADGTLMTSRAGGFTAAISTGGTHGNAGIVCLLATNKPILIDVPGACALPLPDGRAPLAHPGHIPPLDKDFSDDRDIMSADLTDIYPDACGISAYQRTLMVMRIDGSVRLVDALDFAAPCQEIVFRFITAPHPVPMRDRVLLGPVTMRWDGEMTAEITEDGEDCHILDLKMVSPPRRLICGFSFEM